MKSFNEILFKTGAMLRNPKLFDVVKELEKTDFCTREEFREIQAQKLSALFKFHKANSPYYAKLLPNYMSDPHAVLAGLPILTKDHLLAYHDQMQCYNKCDKTFFAETSGSTGQPLVFRKDMTWDTAHRASIIRGYSWYDVNPWERNGYFWGYNLAFSKRNKTLVLDALQNRFRVFSYDKAALKVFLEKMKDAKYIHGYSSMIYEVALLADNLGYTKEDFPALKMVKGTSEKIYDYYHSPVEKVFGHKLVSEYGSAEGGIHAFECKYGNMHINEENIIIEQLEDYSVLITNLNAYSLPIYRYKIGDAVELDSITTCKCGRKSRIVKEVLGRVGKIIYGKSKNYPSLTLYYIFKNIAQQKGVDIQYQGFQKMSGVLELRFSKKLRPEERFWINEQIQLYFKKDIELIILEEVQLHDLKGKLKDFVSII